MGLTELLHDNGGFMGYFWFTLGAIVAVTGALTISVMFVSMAWSVFKEAFLDNKGG